ncbi:HAD family hydrolase [Galactobacter valiniphilus]|uniref:HAD family hydrolase n=1 Tax=Galactobacter valiniphilus TaxID=2676122 RepID=UPI0037370B4A
MIRSVLFDLDGVLRHFDAGFVASIEREHGLTAGALDAAAFEPALLHAVTTGAVTRSAWVRAVGEAVGNPEAGEAWGRQPFSADEAMLELADELRAQGILVAILTNGTDTIDEELAGSGIAARVDRVFNSASIGAAKPDPAAFEHVLTALELEPTEVFFTDDSQHKLDGATRLGMVTHLFQGIGELRTALRRALRVD